MALGHPTEIHALGQPEAVFEVVQGPLLMVWGVPLEAFTHEFEVDSEVH